MAPRSASRTSPVCFCCPPLQASVQQVSDAWCESGRSAQPLACIPSPTGSGRRYGRILTIGALHEWRWPLRPLSCQMLSLVSLVLCFYGKLMCTPPESSSSPSTRRLRCCWSCASVVSSRAPLALRKSNMRTSLPVCYKFVRGVHTLYILTNKKHLHPLALVRRRRAEGKRKSRARRRPRGDSLR